MNKLALILPGGSSINEQATFKFKDSSIADILSALLPYIFTLAGLVLFIMLIMGGFGMLTSAGSPEKMKAAQGKITSAVIGFVIIFISYWLMRILEIVFGLNLLGA
jgi:hypothetical protein